MGITLSENDLQQMREIALRVIGVYQKEGEQGEVAVEGPPPSRRKIRVRKEKPVREVFFKKTSVSKSVRKRGTSIQKSKKTGPDFLHESYSRATFFGVTFYQFLILLFLLIILILNAIWLNMYRLLG